MVATYKPDVINANETHIDNSILSWEILVEMTRFFEKTEILMVVVYINSCFQQIDSDHESNLDSNCEGGLEESTCHGK